MFKYFTVADVLRLHALSIEQFGGASGLRDQGLLEAAIVMPQAAFEGQDLHMGVEAKAAAYLFHISQAHAFVDGNKRTAMAAALTFIRVNGYDYNATDEELIKIGLGVAAGLISKDQLIDQFQKLVLKP
jgi:death on curing protein